LKTRSVDRIAIPLPPHVTVIDMTHRLPRFARWVVLSTLAAVLLIGCTGESPVGAAEDEADLDPTTLRQLDRGNAAYGEVRGVYRTDPGNRMQATRRVESTIAFEVYERRAPARSIDAPTARGHLKYADIWDDQFAATIKYVRFEADGAVTFWGPLRRSSTGEANASWLFVRVQDGGDRPGVDRLTFQVGPPNPGPDARLPDAEGTSVDIKRGNIVVRSSGVRALRLF
jgi:hypothetical protein